MVLENAKISQNTFAKLLGLLGAIIASAFSFLRGIENISITDGTSYLNQAESLLKGQEYIFENPNDFSHGIIFSAILALTFKVLGSSSLILFKLILSSLFGCTIYLLVKIAQEMGLTKVSWVALGLFCTLDPFLLFPATDLQTESVTTFIVVYWAYLYLVPAGSNTFRKLDPILFGMTSSFAILMRPNFLLPVLGIGLLLFYKWKKERFANSQLALTTMLILSIVFLYQIFLVKLYDGFVFLASYGGLGIAYLCKPDFIPQYFGYASAVENQRINNWVLIENPLGKLAETNLINPSAAEANSELFRIGIKICLENPIEGSWLILLRLLSVWRPSVVFGAYSLSIFIISLLFWVPLTYLMIKFLKDRKLSSPMIKLRQYFFVMGGTFTISLLFTFPQVRHRVAFAEVFYILFAVIVLERLYLQKNQKLLKKSIQQITKNEIR
jgi:hypothetical protein